MTMIGVGVYEQGTQNRKDAHKEKLRICDLGWPSSVSATVDDSQILPLYNQVNRIYREGAIFILNIDTLDG